MATDMIEPVAEQAVSDITDVCCSGCKKVLPRTAFIAKTVHVKMECLFNVEFFV